MKILPLFLIINFLHNIFFFVFIPIKISPTGFVDVPPEGPAIPVIETAISVLANLLRFLTIEMHVCSLTAPCFNKLFFETFNNLFFDLFEYTTKPSL